MADIAKAQSVLVVAPNYWGKGATKQEADRQLKLAGYRQQKKTKDNKGKPARVYYLFSCKTDELSVTSDVDVRFSYPPKSTCIRFEEYL